MGLRDSVEPQRTAGVEGHGFEAAVGVFSTFVRGHEVEVAHRARKRGHNGVGRADEQREGLPTCVEINQCQAIRVSTLLGYESLIPSQLPAGASAQVRILWLEAFLHRRVGRDLGPFEKLVLDIGDDAQRISHHVTYLEQEERGEGPGVPVRNRSVDHVDGVWRD